MSLPFACTYVTAFARRVREAAEKDKLIEKGDGTTVTIESLQTCFVTPAWTELKKDGSRIMKLLNSSVFKNDGEAIDVNNLLLFGFLNCPGSVEDKSELLYTIFQDGGKEKHPCLSAMDKDVSPVISKLIHLCTLDLI